MIDDKLVFSATMEINTVDNGWKRDIERRIIDQITQKIIANSGIESDCLRYLRDKIDARLAAITDEQLVDRLYLLAKDIFKTFER